MRFCASFPFSRLSYPLACHCRAGVFLPCVTERARESSGKNHVRVSYLYALASHTQAYPHSMCLTRVLRLDMLQG